nr:hypothetical protein [Lentzea atacamensis]
MRHGLFEGVCDVVGVDVVHQLGADAGYPQRVPGRQRVPDRGVEVSQRTDRWPAGTDDVPRGREAVSSFSIRAMRSFWMPYSPTGAGAGGLGDRPVVTGAVAPDRAAVQQVSGPAAKAVDQSGGRVEREADQVDDDVRRQAGHPVAEGAFLVFPLPVGDDATHLLPLGRVEVGAADAAADVDHFVAGSHQPGHEERADVPASANDDDSHGRPNGTAAGELLRRASGSPSG